MPSIVIALTNEQWVKLGAGLFAAVYGLSHFASKWQAYRSQHARIGEQQAVREDRRATAADAVLEYQLKTEIAFRADLLSRIGKLEAKDNEQQVIIEEQQTTIDILRGHVERLEEDLHVEKQVKHTYRNQLAVASAIIAVYRKKHGRDEGDTFEQQLEGTEPKKEHPDEA